ncbi:hypothetical protein [Bradyrhizobium sp. BR 10261]|uniref:hypothetical protein n=1 Tax=Bradyrhizobium sp. BR 10261 TaxID=2749992 RepID=UPI001C64628A|nr:hypothetical protein [Bradyrhizobium sp. BR 10261]MBW7961852.1 hypothetical protein [Bradyrhizobium sp. BR 10261]
MWPLDLRIDVGNEQEKLEIGVSRWIACVPKLPKRFDFQPGSENLDVARRSLVRSYSRSSHGFRVQDAVVGRVFRNTVPRTRTLGDVTGPVDPPVSR